MNGILHIAERLFPSNIMMQHFFSGILSGLIILLTGKILKYALHFVGKVIFSRTKNTLDNTILDVILERIIAIAGIIGLFVGMREVQKGISSDHSTLLSIIEYSNQILYVVAVLVVTSVLSRLTKAVVAFGLQKNGDKNENINLSLVPLVSRLSTILFFSIASIIILDHFGQNITSILTLLGAGSLALGLAAQDTISNMISGFIIMLDRPFRIGDRIKIPTGEVGDIFEIGLRSTKILDFDNNLIIVPNNDLVKTRVINFGYPAGEIRVVVEVGVAYGSDADMVKDLLIDVAQKNPEVLKTPSPEAFLTNFGESSIDFRLVCRVSSFKNQFITAEKLRIKIYKEFMKKGIEIPFPQRVIHTPKDSSNVPPHRTPKRKKISR